MSKLENDRRDELYTRKIFEAENEGKPKAPGNNLFGTMIVRENSAIAFGPYEQRASGSEINFQESRSILRSNTPLTIEEFNKQHGKMRRTLALMQLKGEKLDPVQESYLEQLNGLMRSLMQSEKEIDPKLRSIRSFLRKYSQD